jgi:hypothetical protein
MKHLLLTTIAAVVLVGCATTVSAQQSSNRGLKLFDGEPKALVVNGYSTSFQWPKILQRKLDNYFDGNRVIEVKLATQGGTPIAKWINLETGQPLAPWIQKLRPLLKDKKQPTLVLAQQSLQWAFGDRSAGIRSAQDTGNIRKGAGAIKKYADLLLADGADEVFIGMHIYKKPMEPVIGNERLALAEYMKSQPQHVHAGPDVWQPTSKVWPQAFRVDKVHPNEMGSEIMAQHWFAALLKHDGREIPSWSEEEMKKAIANPPKKVAGGGRNIVERILRHDKNGDGKVTKEEFNGNERVFIRFDKDSDGVLSKEEISSQGGRRSDQPPPQTRRQDG